MASGGPEEDDGGIPLDVDNVHMLLQVEHEQTQKRTFTNWINAQLAKRCPPSRVSDLFSDLRDGSQLLNLLEVMSGQTMKRQRGHGLFQQRTNIETALNFLKNKSIKLVNINIPDIIAGRPSVILGLVWTIILHCHIEELASVLSFTSRHSSLDSSASLDSWSSSPVPASPVPPGQASSLHRHFGLSAKKALLTWVRDRCQRVGSSISVRDFTSSWRSGEAFLAILCSLRPQLIDLSLIQNRSNQENLEQAFHLAERELNIPRLLEPRDVDVNDPDEKSIMMYVAQFLQYSNDMPAPDDQPQLQRCQTALDLSLPPALHAVVVWLQRAEAALTDEGGSVKDHAGIAKDARAQQDTLKTVIKEMSHYVQILDAYHNTDESGNVAMPPEELDEIKRRLTHIRVAVKDGGIKLEYQESRHSVLDLLGRISAKVHTWKTPYRSKEDVHLLLQDWHETVEHECVLMTLTDALQNLKEKANAYTCKAALGEDSQLVTRQLKEIESEAELVTHAVMAVRGTMERTTSAWETHNKCFTSLKTWLEQTNQSQNQPPSVEKQDMSEWASCQAKLNEVGNFLIEVTETSTSCSLAEQLSKVNLQWAECIKSAKFEASSEPTVSPPCRSLVQEANRLLRQPLEVASMPLKANRQELQLLRKKLANVHLSSHSPFPDFPTENLQPALPQILAEAERTCGELQKAASEVEGCLAELDHWGTEALACYQHLKETAHRGHSALEPAAKALIFRGSQLQNQAVTKGQELHKLVAVVQKASPLQHFSTSGVQDRISEGVSCCQEILTMLSFPGSNQRLHEPVHQTRRESESLVMARTNQVDQAEHVTQQIQDPSRLSSQISFHVSIQKERSLQAWPETQRMNTQDHTTIVMPHVEIQMPSQKSPVPSTHVANRVTEEKGSKFPSQTQPNPLQSNETSPQTPVIVCSEVRSKAQSMAKSRVEKARRRLQGRIQQAIKLFDGREILCSQVKKKQKALKILQPVILQEFLDAVEGLGAFCSKTHLQDLMLLSDSVRKQWEGARKEMAAFVPILCSKLVVQCEIHTNALQEATDKDFLQRQQQAATSAEQRLESLQELCGTLTPSKSSHLATDQLQHSADTQETEPGDTCLPADGGGQQPGGDSLLRATGISAGMQPSNGLRPKQSVDIPHRDPSPVPGSVQPRGDILSQGSQDVPTDIEDHVARRRSSESGNYQTTSLRVPEHLPKARLLQETPTLTEAPVRSDTVETKQEAEPTVTPPHEKHPSEQEALDRMASLESTADMMESAHLQMALINQKLQKIISESVEFSSFTSVDAGLISDLKAQRRRGPTQDKAEKENSDDRRAALFVELREIKVATEQLGLQEPTLPALQHRSRVLTELESRLAGLLTELHHMQDASRSETPDVSPTTEVANLWEETTKAVAERLEQCCILTELLRKFRRISCDLSGALQRAETTIGEQASYMGKDNLHRIHSKVQGTKAELNGLGKHIEEVQSVCRQLHTHLRHIPECTIFPFEREADGLMDQWLDISERTDSHLDNLHVGLNLWDGVLQLAADVERWTTDKLAVFAESPSFQTECDINTLQNEIATQEESIEHFHRRVAEIQSLLQTTEIPLELQMVESQLKKKMEQLKELVCEAEDVYRQTVAAKGQLTVRLNTCWDSLHEIQDSLLTLSGSDVASVLAKLKNLCWQLQTQEEQVDSLLEDLHAVASIAGPDRLETLSEEGVRLQEKVRNTHQLFSEVQEHTEKDIQDLGRLQREREHLEQWLKTVEQKSAKKEDFSLLQEETLQQRLRAELLSQLVSSLQKSSLQQATPVEESRKLLERYSRFSSNTLGDTKGERASLKRDIEVFQALSSFTQSWVRDLRQLVSSAFDEHLGIQSLVEQRFQCAQAVVGAPAEGQARLKELRGVGNGLTQRLCDSEALILEIQESVQATEQLWRDLLQSGEPYYRVLQTDPEFTSSYLAQRLEAHCRVVEGLTCQTDQLPTSFLLPGIAERRRVCSLACQLCNEAQSLQLALAILSRQRREQAEKTSDAIWKDASWAKLYDYWSGVMAELKGVCSCLKEGASNEEYFDQLLQDCHHKLASLQERLSACQAQNEPLTDLPALEASLQEAMDTDNDILQLAAPGDSVTASSTAEVVPSQPVGNLQSQEGAVESSVREGLALLGVHHEGVQHVRGQLSCGQTTPKDVAENVTKSCENQEFLPDINQLKLRWSAIQVSDARVAQLAARADRLQKSGELSVKQELMPADVISTLDTVSKDLHSLRVLSLQKKQECTENTANWMRQVTDQLHQWSQMVQGEAPPPSQAVLDEGLLRQQSLCELLSDKDFLLNCLGAEVSNKLQKHALDALSESTSALETMSKHQAIRGHQAAESEHKYLMGETAEEQTDHKIKITGTFSATLQENQPSTELGTNTRTNLASDGTEQDRTCTSMEQVDVSVACASEGLIQQALEPNEVLTAEIPDVFKSESQELTQQEDTEELQEDTTSSSNKEVCPTALAGSLLMKPGSFSLSTEHLAAQPEAFHMVNNAQEPEKRSEDIGVTPKNVVTIVLNMKPPDMQRDENVGPDLPGCCVCNADGAEASSMDCNEKSSGVHSTLTNLKNLNLAAQSETSEVDTNAKGNECEDTSARPKKVFTIVLELKPQDVQQRENVGAITSDLSRCSERAEPCNEKVTPPYTENTDTGELMHHELLNSSISCHAFPERQLSGANAAKMTFPVVRQEAVTDSCHHAAQMMSPVSCPVRESVQTGNAFTEIQIFAGVGKRRMAGDLARSTDAGQPQMAEEGRGLEGPKPEHSDVLERRDDVLLKEGESKFPWWLTDTGVSQRLLVCGGSMEPERAAQGLSAELGAGETESFKHKSTMQDLLSDIQSAVGRSSIINRTAPVDLNWYLQASPGELEIRLVQNVQQVLACRYQPAQLDVRLMAKQLKEAEEYSRCVQEQVAALKSWTAARVCDSTVLMRAEQQWSAALLHASATVQVKAAQLDQVKQYHTHMKMTRAFLEVLAAEKQKMSLDALGSSAAQTDKLHALMQTMKQKKSMIAKLLQLSSQLSVHLSVAESSGALLAWLGDVQEEWRCLEGSLKRALQHTSNTTSQFTFLIKEAKHLKTKLEPLQESSYQSSDCKSGLELVCLTTDLKLYHQLYLQLKYQSDALIHFSLGQKERNEIQHNLWELGSLLDVAKRKVDVSTHGCGSNSSVMVNKQLRDLIVWAKQAEYHISIGKTLALFPEEARVQIAEMKTFHTDILSRQSKMQVQVDEMNALTTDITKEERDQVMKTVEDLYEAIADSLDHVLDTMKKNLQKREKLLSQLASVDAWLTETLATRDPCRHVENVSKADIKQLESELQRRKSFIVELESQLGLVEAMAESCKDIAVGLIPGESRYLVNRLSGLGAEIDGLLVYEKTTSWELEALIRERTTSDVEVSTIQASLKLIASDLERQRSSLSQETPFTITCLNHMLIEHQCEVQELQHCQDEKRSSLLHTIGELQDRCKTASVIAFEQHKYLYLRKQVEESMDIIKEQIQWAKDEASSVDKRFTLCQTLLVELPMVKTQCQDARSELEAIVQELNPSEFNGEMQRIERTVETLVSWEASVTDDIKILEAMLLPHLRFSSEHHALIKLFRRSRAELEGAKLVGPDHQAIDGALQRCWVIWRNMESGMRVLDALGQKEEINLENCKDLYSLRDAIMQECHLKMGSLSQARESLKDYQWAAQAAIGFLHNAKATFSSAPAGILDCTEEHRRTQQALEALEDGFQAHICHIGELVPQQPCLFHPNTEQLHVDVLSQLLVGKALLKAQAQLRLEFLQRCKVRQQSHSVCHEDLQQRLSECEARLSEWGATHVTSYYKCAAQQQTAMLLMEDLHSLARKMEELKAECPNQGCEAGKDGELGALWRRWVSSRRHVGLLLLHIEQRREEWKDITRSMEQCCSFLASFQAEVQDASSVSFTHEEPQELLARAEMLHAGLEQELQVLASLERRLAHALSLSISQDHVTSGPIGKTLMKIQQNIGSLKEANLLVVAVAEEEEKQRRQIHEDMGELEKRVCNMFPALAACSNPSKQQELKNDLSSQKTKLKFVTEDVQSRYAVVPADVRRRLQEIQQSLQRAEEKLAVSSSLVQKLAGRVVELVSGLEMVKGLLERRSPAVGEAQSVLKHVWDKLDIWHSRLMLLESEVQDLAEEQPDQAHVLMDQLTQPLQLYQNTAQLAEQRTSFISKIPACLQEFEDVLYSATCWLDEAQTWLNTRCAFTTARSFKNHANSLQLVLDDSERIRDTLRDFRTVLAEISAVCDISTEEERLEQKDQQVHKMQCNILEPLEQLLQAAEVVEAVEAELKTMEKNIPKIRTILSSMENSDIALTEHLQNRQVILANVQSMQRTLEEMEKGRGALLLPRGGEENLVAFSRAKLLLQQLEELKRVTRQQASLLQNKMSTEDGTSASPAVTTVSKEACEMAISEEADDEDNESCHSSSSDTLTCSIPEDPEEAVDVPYEDIAEIKAKSNIEELNISCALFPSDVETSSERAETGLVRAGFDTNDVGSKDVETGLKTMDSIADVVETFSLDCAPVEALILADTPAAEDKFPAADLLEQQTLVSDPPTKSLLAIAALENTRLIPARPITPFAAATSVMFIEEGDEDLATAPTNDMVTSGLKGQLEPCTSCSNLEESSKVPISSLAGHDDGEEGQSWSRLHSLISRNLTILKNVQEEHQTVISANDGGTYKKMPQREPVPSKCVSAVLQQAHKSITMLRRTVNSAGRSHPGVEEQLYEAVQSALHCTDLLIDLLSTPCGAGEDDPQLRLLQQEVTQYSATGTNGVKDLLKCVLTDLGALAELLTKAESQTQSVLVREEPDALRCLTCLQDCLHTVRLVFTSSRSHLTEQPSIAKDQELSSNQMCILDSFDLEKNEIFPSPKNAPGLEQCVLGRHLKGRPGETVRLQQASRSLLQGIIHLLDLGEECKTEVQMSHVHSTSQLQAILCGRKKLLQVVGSQLAFVQHLFEREPEALKCQEDERVRLEVRARALQQQALEQEVVLQTRLQEWSQWENNCGHLARVLNELEAFISNREPEGDDDTFITQHRLDACQQALVQLDGSRAALGLLQDQRSVLLQSEPPLSVSWAGGALELRWKRAYRQAEQEVRRCRDVQDGWSRFQRDVGSVSEWLVGANKRLKTWSDLANTSAVNQGCVHGHVIRLLDFSKELEATLVKKASASSEGTKLMRLKETDGPRVRAQLVQLDVSWNQLTSDLFKIQDQLQQRLVAGWPPEELLSHLEKWLKTQEAQLNKEKETALKAKDAADISEVLQHLQELKAGAVSGQSLLDFLCQPEPQVLGEDVHTRVTFAETLGALRLRWTDFQMELESQFCKVGQMRHTCADRDKHLKRFSGLTVQQNEQLNRWKQLTNQTLLRKALEEWEAAEARVKEVAAALRELKATQADAKKDEAHPCDAAFCFQADLIINACEDLFQQMGSLRPALEQTAAHWRHYDRAVKEVCLHCTRVRCALQHLRAPLFSLQQAEGRVHMLQQLEEKAGKGEELWAAVEESYQRLVQSLHRATSQALRAEMEQERKRWGDTVQELKDERTATAEALSLWREYGRLSESCSLRLQSLWRQWEELSACSALRSVQDLQDAAEGLQRSVGDVLIQVRSKPLTGRLQSLAANVIQSETRRMSQNVLLLSRAISGKKRSLQDHLENENIFNTRLEAANKQMQSIALKIEGGFRETTSVQQVLSELSCLFLSLVDVMDMSSYAAHNNRAMARLRLLSREWTESLTRTCEGNWELQAEHLTSQSFEDKCKSLTRIQEKLEQESVPRNAQSSSGLQEMLVGQQAEVVTGHQLLHSLLCDAVSSLEEETGEKRSELLALVSRVKASWFHAVARTDRSRSWAMERLHLWRTHRHGSKRLWKVLRDMEPLLPPSGPAPCALLQTQSCGDDHQCFKEALRLHASVFAQTMEASRRLYETMTESESRSQLQSECWAIEEAWKRTASLLERRTDAANTTVQKWSECQRGITNSLSELNELKQQLTDRPAAAEDDAFIQEAELSLQRVTCGLRQLDAMKTDLHQHVVSGDSALLEQQLEQLHGQWEELRMKVSLRKQEIADRLNAWTIFNDKNKEFCDWLTQMEDKVRHGGDLSVEEMVEKLKKDCMEEINLFSENKSHLKQLGEQLLLASDEATRTQVHGSLQELNQRWHSLFHHVEARVKKLKETLVTVQQLDKNMSSLRSWLSRIEGELSRPITYSVCHQQEIQKRLAEQQELQEDIEQHTEGVASVLSLCDVLLRDEDAGGGAEVESDSLQETSRSLDQRWRTICALALDRRLRIEETWKLWCKFLEDYSRFEDWLKMAERTAANPSSADILYTVAKEELKKFEGFQRQVHERLTQLELVNNQYRRLARENRTDRASQLKAMVHEGNRRWDTLHRRVAAILRRLKHFTSQREDFESTRESMLVWLTELDLQLTNVEHFSESDVHQKMQQLNSFQREITLNTEHIDGLIVFGEGLIQKSSPQDAALIEDELEELHSYCQEVFSRLVRFHQRLSQPPMIKEPEVSSTIFSLESSLELICRPRLGRSQGHLPATPTHLLTSPLERSGRETPLSVDSLPLEWDPSGDVGGSSSHDEDEEEGAFFSALSASSRAAAVHESPGWVSPGETQTNPVQLDTEEDAEAAPVLTSTPQKQGYPCLTSQCSGSIENIRRVSLILEDEQQPLELGLTGLTAVDKQSGVIERWELLQAQPTSEQQAGPQQSQQLTSDLSGISLWLENVIPKLDNLQQSDLVISIEDMEVKAKELKEMQKTFTRYKSVMLSVNLRAQVAPELQENLAQMNRDWSRACTGLQQWDTTLRETLMRCQEFHETLHSLLLWLAHAESRRYAVDISHAETPATALQHQRDTLTALQEELQGRRAQQASLQALWAQLQPKDRTEESCEAQEKLHVTGSKLKLLLKEVNQDLSTLQQRLTHSPDIQAQRDSCDSSKVTRSTRGFSTLRERRESSPPRSFFYRVLRAAFPLHLLLLLLLLLPCLMPLSESDPGCTVTNNFARSFYPMLHYTNGPPPT